MKCTFIEKFNTPDGKEKFIELEDHEHIYLYIYQFNFLNEQKQPSLKKFRDHLKQNNEFIHDLNKVFWWGGIDDNPFTNEHINKTHIED